MIFIISFFWFCNIVFDEIIGFVVGKLLVCMVDYVIFFGVVWVDDDEDCFFGYVMLFDDFDVICCE